MRNLARLGIAAVTMGLFPVAGYCWYGPTCYPEQITTVSMTLPTIVGEAPGDVKVEFDNAGIVELDSIKASKSVARAHEITLKRNAQSANGITGVIVTSPRSTVGYKFELEFRKSVEECSGAIIRVSTDKGTSPKPKARPKAVSPAVEDEKDSEANSVSGASEEPAQAAPKQDSIEQGQQAQESEVQGSQDAESQGEDSQTALESAASVPAQTSKQAKEDNSTLTDADKGDSGN